MNNSTAQDFYNDVENALNEAFDDVFWGIDTETYSDEANIYISINYDDVPEYLEDVFTEIEDALEDVIYDWNCGTDWQDNTFELCITDDDDD